MSFTNASVIKVINHYTSQYIKQIEELKIAIEQNVSVDQYNQLKKKFDDLTERHNEIKQAYIEADRENEMLRKQNMELKSEQESMVMDVEQFFKNLICPHSPPHQTPTQVSSPPNQKVKHRDSKNLLNFQRYESDTESEDSNVMPTPNTTPSGQTVQAPNVIKLDVENVEESNDDEDEMDIEIMKKLLGEGLMNELEKTINDYSQSKTPTAFSGSNHSQNTSTAQNQVVPRFVFMPNSTPTPSMFGFGSNVQSNNKPNEQNQGTQVNESQSKRPRTHHPCHRIHRVQNQVHSGNQDVSEAQLLNLLINSLINPRSK
jgi:hypothetical protein